MTHSLYHLFKVLILRVIRSSGILIVGGQPFFKGKPLMVEETMVVIEGMVFFDRLIMVDHGYVCFFFFSAIDSIRFDRWVMLGRCFQ